MFYSFYLLFKYNYMKINVLREELNKKVTNQKQNYVWRKTNLSFEVKKLKVNKRQTKHQV
ncbi:Uncharacterised protein [Capnocytophaga canimorsus]|nr:Uncharacterised protein [Capnocytophaga canimorsus]